MKVQSFLVFLLAIALLCPSCDKKEDDDPDGQDKTFFFTCKVNGKAWSSENTYNALTSQFYNIDTLPAALISNDSVMIAASSTVEGFQTTLVLLGKHTNAANVSGTYEMTGNLLNFPSQTSIGVYIGTNNDLATYALGAQTGALEYSPGSKLVVSKHAENKITGIFNFQIRKVSDQSVLYDVTEGRFQNLELK